MNPPLPVDEHGNWYRGDEEEDEEEEEEEEKEEGKKTAAAARDDDDGGGSDADGLTDAERAILADIDQL